ncbi:hypothetical protein [Oryza sativa Japonica Group]|uniref:Uncharacterized protein n=2 Tax=Oryza sativa subsp. japonica TaxID=39947 RepID=Q5JLJ7_ORYSJ|nr:hypothetical protein [Oryza sativa Japonica Group]BAD87945.1 hypothetical protein [Oryza sativa Japonica Group]
MLASTERSTIPPCRGPTRGEETSAVERVAPCAPPVRALAPPVWKGFPQNHPPKNHGNKSRNNPPKSRQQIKEHAHQNRGNKSRNTNRGNKMAARRSAPRGFGKIANTNRGNTNQGRRQAPPLVPEAAAACP